MGLTLLTPQKGLRADEGVVEGAERGIGVNGMRMRRGLCADALGCGWWQRGIGIKDARIAQSYRTHSEYHC